MAFDLRTSEIEHQFIQDRIDLVNHQMSELSAGFGAYNRKIAHERDCGDKLAKTLLRLAAKEILNPTLRSSLAKFSDIIHAVQDYRDTEVQRIDHIVIIEFDAYTSICKQAKEQLKKGFDTRAKELTKKRQLDKMRGKKPTDWQQINQAEREAERAKAEATQATMQLSHEIDSFERKKLEDIKSTLMDFIRVELLFHAKALELYTKAYQIMDSVNINNDLHEFRNHFRVSLSTVDATDIRIASNSCGDSNIAPHRAPPQAKQSTPLQRETILQERLMNSQTLSSPALSSSSSDVSDASSLSEVNQDGKRMFRSFKDMFASRRKNNA